MERADKVREAVDAVYRTESRRVLATLIRLLGDFDLAEEALQDAVVAALERWPIEGVPANPRAWMISAGRFKAIDKLRRRARQDQTLESVVDRFETAEWREEDMDDGVADDRLRLIFTCCHPALSADAHIALTLREVCGLTTEQVASAFLTPASTLAQRIVRAKTKIRDAGIPYEIPSQTALPERLDSVLHVIYLVFNEGYSASSGNSLTRPDLSAEAIRLGQLIVDLLPESEAIGLLALMLLHDARSASRLSAEGELVLLENQDRSLWKRDRIADGGELLKKALAVRPVGPYALQAAIAAIHAEASDWESTDWNEIVGIYDLLFEVEPTPVVALNRAAAIAMLRGPEHGLRLIDALLADGSLSGYRLAHAARADLCRRLDRMDDAVASYKSALALATQEPERRFLQKRISDASGET